MRGTTLLCSLIGLSTAFAIGALTGADAQTTALRGARVIDGSGGAPIDNATIVMRDGRIVAVGPSASTSVPDGAEIVDYGGKTIMPGLISAHAHAAALKLDDRGTLAAGKLADLVVLDADPSSRIANTTKIHAVWHRGRKAAGPVDSFTP